MNITSPRCPVCAAVVEVDNSSSTGMCMYCGSQFLVETSEKLSNIGEHIAEQLKNLRQLQKQSAEVNNFRQLADISRAILTIVMDDYLSTYYYAYGESLLGNNSYILSFYKDATQPCTQQDMDCILTHINKYSALSDRAMIVNYIYSLDIGDVDTKLRQYMDAFNSRKKLEEHSGNFPIDVFVCHPNINHDIVSSVVTVLEKDGNKCWVSYRNQRPNNTANYWNNIRNAIDNCKLFLVVCSADAMLSDDVKMELSIAKELKKPRLEYKIDNEPHTTRFKDFFDGIQWVDGVGNSSEQLAELCNRVAQEQIHLDNDRHKEKDVDKRARELAEEKDRIAQEKAELERQRLEFARMQAENARLAQGTISQPANTIPATGGVNIDNLLIKAELFIEDGDTAEANKVLDRISDIDVTCAHMWWCKFLIANNLPASQAVSEQTCDYTSDKNYSRAMRFGSQSQQQQWSSLVNTAKDNIDKQKVQGTTLATINAVSEQILNKKAESNSLAKEVATLPAQYREYTVWPDDSIAFSGDYNNHITDITHVRINNGITYIPAEAFKYNKGLVDIYIPDSVTSIGDSAFKYCRRLTSITLPDSVTAIGKEAFTDCYALTSISIPNSVTSIGAKAFVNCLKLTSIKLPSRITCINDDVFCDCNKLTNITIPSGVAHIGDRAFLGCCNLTSIKIPNRVGSIGKYAFSDCHRLTTVNIPSALINIGEYAFEHCISLTHIINENGINNFSKYRKLLGDLSQPVINRELQNHHMTFDTSKIIPCKISADRVVAKLQEFKNDADRIRETLAEEQAANDSVALKAKYAKYTVWPDDSIAFSGDWYYSIRDITHVRIKDGVTEIPAEAFRYNEGLVDIYIPNSVTSIGDRAFYYCRSLTSITIPNSVTSIGSCAFRNCKSFTSIIIPDSVTSIGSDAFDDCSSLTSITVAKGNKKYKSVDGVLYSQDMTSIVRVPASCKLMQFTIPNSVTSIGSCAFRNCKSLASITIPNSVASIGSNTFNDCSSLTSIIIPDSVTSIGSDAFNDCSSHTSITVAKGNKKYKSVDGVLYSQDMTSIVRVPASCKLTQFTIPNSVTSIGDCAFRNCRSLASIKIPNSVTSIGAEAFACCFSLSSIRLPKSVTSIGESAFGACSVLTSIDIPNKVTSIARRTFINCSHLSSITIPSSVTSIGEGAFVLCGMLTSITIPKSVTSIGKEAFFNARALKKIIINAKKRNVVLGADWDNNCPTVADSRTDGKAKVIWKG